ncbi:carbohydrate ABC transporter permease [Ferroacidibacillus organovorans]|uniref:Sugar ABC transporter permease n=1 Tax=Ferroacidibacillus organovorans TaxID=1765683 RepID=A0A101XTA5_9BACL|nr:carbohydrate ABC transporter permease [Ferroacidibacillus organovorans]KUO97177.1 sugar ABC transporter permease [Ferroacidibacillus organovorans]
MMVSRNLIGRIVAHLTLILLSVVILAPIYFTVVSALSSNTSLFRNALHLWPQGWHFENFVRAWRSQPFATYFFNSFVSNFLIVAAQLITSTLAAYGFAMVPFRGARTAFFVTLLGMMVPTQAVFIPVYLMLAQVHLINTYAGLVLPFVGSAFGIFLLRQGFLAIPKELIAAAQVDGASHLRILWSIVLPNAKASLVTLAILNFVFHYDSLFWPLIATNSNGMRTIPVALSYFLDQESAGNGLAWNLMMAADLFAVLPVLILFVLGQRFIIRGVTSYGVKG